MANTTTGDGLVYASFPIIKSEEDAEGNLIVYGKATDGSVDSDLQVVDPQGSAEALRKWLDTGGNVRVQHNPKLYPAGRGLEVETTEDGHFVKSLVVEDTAKKLVKAGVLRAYSVGIAHPVIERDMTGKARGGVIKFGENTEICEISLVDRPANRNCGITLVKSADAPNRDEWTYGDLDALLEAAEKQDAVEKAATPQVGEVDARSLRDVFTQERAAWRVSEPSIDKVASGTDYLVARASWQKWQTRGEDLGFEDDDFELFVAKRKFDPNVGGGVDRDKIPAEDFAGKDRSFPIVIPQDVADAASSIGRAGDDNYSSDQLKANIIRIAKRKGAAFTAKLPDAWKVDVADIEKGKKKKPAFDGAAEPFGKEDADGKDSDGDGKDMDGKPATKGAKDCPKCGHDYDADSPAKRCESCGTKLKSVKKSAKLDKVLDAVRSGIMSIEEARAELGLKSGSLMPGSGLDAGPATSKPSNYGEQGPGSHAMKPAGEHREPDGTSTVEVLEPQMGAKTDPDPVADKVPASVKGEPSYAVLRMHDALCAAYSENSVKAVYPSLDTIADAIDPNFWRDAAAEADRAGKAKKTARLRALTRDAEAVKSVDPALLADARAELEKSFTDLYPNVHLTPAAPPQPGQFRRPFIGTGHALMHPTGSPRIPGSTHVPDPDDFDRGPLTAGQQRQSPGNKSGNNPTFATHSGVRGFYPAASREATRNALQNLHDQIAKTYPDMCSLAPSAGPVPPAGMNGTSTPNPVNPPNQGRAPGEKTVDTEVVKNLVTEQVTALRGEYEEKISKMQKEIDALGSQADPTQAPPRGAVRKPVESDSPVEKAATAPADVVSEDAQFIAYLMKARDTSPAAADRERAAAVLEELVTKRRNS